MECGVVKHEKFPKFTKTQKRRISRQRAIERRLFGKELEKNIQEKAEKLPPIEEVKLKSLSSMQVDQRPFNLKKSKFKRKASKDQESSQELDDEE